jgi:hypothetical protein
MHVCCTLAPWFQRAQPIYCNRCQLEMQATIKSLRVSAVSACSINHKRTPALSCACQASSMHQIQPFVPPAAALQVADFGLAQAVRRGEAIATETFGTVTHMVRLLRSHRHPKSHFAGTDALRCIGTLVGHALPDCWPPLGPASPASCCRTASVCFCCPHSWPAMLQCVCVVGWLRVGRGAACACAVVVGTMLCAASLGTLRT